MAVLDEANPIDRNWRVEGHRWWPEESITEAELRTLGSEHADLLVGHDAPLHLPSLDSHLRSTATLGDHRMRAFAEAGRRMFHRGFLQVQPALYVGGHYNRFMDQTIEYDQSGQTFRCRVVLLAANDLSDDEDALLVSRRADVILHRVLAAAHNPRGKNT
ncbi:hypothetical protein GCM10007382_28440 [Salinibacterium xinjiangense]|nr:hypothetical protein [Salinibacterium xinjiangense]GGL06746.1 hypothetical protein GCM10007382_28440 [Salinibacterium xinjiangense]